MANPSVPDRPPTWLRRIIRWPATRLVIAILVVGLAVGVVRALLAYVFRSLTGTPLGVDSFAFAIPILLTAHFSYVLYVRVVERRPVLELAARGAPREIGAGLLLGGVLFALTMASIAAAGSYRIAGWNGWLVLGPPLAASLGSGYVEEVLFRGVLFRIVEEGLGTWLGLLISAGVFGIAHLSNPGATVVSALAIMLEAGVLLGAAFVLTRRLWLAIGIHVAWNFTQGGIFGVAVSGHRGTGLMRAQLSGSSILSGGSFGAEASIFAVLFCLAAAACLLWRARRMGHFLRPCWARGR